jgi:hypothetical protein
MNTRADLETITQKAFSSTAYRIVDDEYIVVGKHCRCAYLGNDCWDIWLCNPADLVAGLSQRKVRSISARIAEILPQQGGFRELTGEGVYPSMSTADLLRSAPLLGIKRRRAANPEATRRLMEHRSAAA